MYTAPVLTRFWTLCLRSMLAHCPRGTATSLTQVLQSAHARCRYRARVHPVNVCLCHIRVCLSLVERILDRRLPRRESNQDGPAVTLFQLWTYLDANNICDLEAHLSELAKEGTARTHTHARMQREGTLAESNGVPPTVRLVHSLASSDQDVIVQALKRPAECSLRKDGLGAVVKLLKDPRGKVSASASSVLRSLCAQPRQREQVNPARSDTSHMLGAT